MPVPEIMKLSFHDPMPFLRDPSTLSQEEQAALSTNALALAAYAPSMTDPTLAARLERSQHLHSFSGEQASESPTLRTAAETPELVIEIISAELRR
jgi:hypothetical protein